MADRSRRILFKQLDAGASVDGVPAPVVGRKQPFTLLKTGRTALAIYAGKRFMSNGSDENGDDFVDVWCNEDGIDATTYVTTHANGEISPEFTVPYSDGSPVQLSTLISLGIGVGTSQGESVLAVVEAEFSAVLATAVSDATASLLALFGSIAVIEVTDTGIRILSVDPQTDIEDSSITVDGTEIGTVIISWEDIGVGTNTREVLLASSLTDVVALLNDKLTAMQAAITGANTAATTALNAAAAYLILPEISIISGPAIVANNVLPCGDFVPYGFTLATITLRAGTAPSGGVCTVDFYYTRAGVTTLIGGVSIADGAVTGSTTLGTPLALLASDVITFNCTAAHGAADINAGYVRAE